jgi:hypothetical protein
MLLSMTFEKRNVSIKGNKLKRQIKDKSEKQSSYNMKYDYQGK